MGINRRDLFKAMTVAPTIAALSRESGLPMPEDPSPRRDPFEPPIIPSGMYTYEYTRELVDVTMSNDAVPQYIAGPITRRRVG